MQDASINHFSSEYRRTKPSKMLRNSQFITQLRAIVTLPLKRNRTSPFPVANPSTVKAVSEPLRPVSTVSQVAVPQSIYVGLEIVLPSSDGPIQYALSVHDGSYSIDYFVNTIDIPKVGTFEENFAQVQKQLLETIRSYSDAQNYKVQAIALSMNKNGQDISEHLFRSPSFMSKIWSDLDAIPFIQPTQGALPDQRASSAIRNSLLWITPQFPGSIPRVSIGYRYEVEVDLNGTTHLVDLSHYKTTVCAETWRVLNAIADEVRQRGLRISFFNSTPQGGGVALMRHALIRLLRLLKINVHWYVAMPKPAVFDITKRKFHNVLQGVAPPDVFLGEADKQAFIDWSDENVERMWNAKDGPLVNSDFIVMDDPQVTGIIPHIRRLAPAKTRVVYRSHIEVRSDLIREKPKGAQAETWNFLWNFIRQTDLFISHPMPNFIPDVVPKNNVVLLPACTDPLDGLNKSMRQRDIEYYQQAFNRVCADQGSAQVDWRRPYVVQVARFDPSKGIPDVVDSFYILRERMAKSKKFTDLQLPQLVICGHGSVDDPDGTLIYKETYALIHTNKYKHLASDIIIARIPPSDQLLNVIMRCAYAALQLSHREGFEVKVTEAIQKGVPIVAYRAGGIPLQITDGDEGNGYLVPVGDTAGVADRLYALFENPELRKKISETAIRTLTEEWFTVFNAINWLFLANEMTRPGKFEVKGLEGKPRTPEENSGIGNARWLRECWAEKYGYKTSKNPENIPSSEVVQPIN